jgi:hypothetical protein
VINKFLGENLAKLIQNRKILTGKIFIRIFSRNVVTDF